MHWMSKTQSRHDNINNVMTKTNRKRCYVILFGGFFVVAMVTSHFVNMRSLHTTLALYKDSSSHRPEFDLAWRQSYGFFDDITNENWQLLRKIALEHVNHKYPRRPLTHNPAYDHRKIKYFNSAPAWWQTVSVFRCDGLIA
jgi:hypothetical protein